MATGIYSWSQTAASNNSADSTINWAEGQAPSTVNDSSRAVMAVLAKWRDDISGVQPSNVIQTTAGSANAQTLTSNGSIAALTNGWTLTFKVGSGLNNTGACTLAVDSLTAKNLQTVSGTSLVGGELLAGSVYTVTYHQPADSWVLHGGPMPAEALLTSGSASGATLDIVLTNYTTFRAIKFVLTSVGPVSTDATLRARFSTNGGSTYISGASAYAWTRYELSDTDSVPGSTVDSADSEISLTTAVGASNACNITATLFDQTSTGIKKRLRFEGDAIDSSGSLTSVMGSGVYNTASDDVDAVRFLFSAGNISYGSYAVYGLR